ncbi:MULTISPECIES: peptide chain release factor N(5)-glutamine methyltransferase [Okeania]|uniref:Release factor glutamine methyltransferase n=1 Tax=Okeania hirsuta TaxID=1458930 RepID=A0A3N6R6W7_9CYAN|nr:MULTISPECIES: peptide chain release factor N(5)-glutamine methyltransferase [Okeania]NES90207.1 peptide chain release factor N(5)-glutamine methyltransferase [Okeania sp. SIO2B9]RQH27523.1 peptide chain release factor N(5)-glutamine methyltransferase [Okeania hirsuta]
MDFSSECVVSGLDLWQWYRSAQSDGLKAGIYVAEVDWLLQEFAGLDRLTLRLESFKDWPNISMRLSLVELNNLWYRRLNEKVPLQYLIGVTYWRNFSLEVDFGVLIPRPETECLIDLVVAATNSVSHLQQGIWVDMGTGSGAIAFGLAEVLTDASIYAVDCSSEALAIARQNGTKLGLGNKINFCQGSWWEPLEHLRGKVSGMVANPPYIPSDMVSTLQPEVRKHEPHLALDGGIDGLEFIRFLIETAPLYLVSGGVWLVEVMSGQGDKVAEMLQDNGAYCGVEIFPDIEGVDRFAMAYLK